MSSEFVNPGEALRDFLCSLFPQDLEERGSCIAKIDSALLADGELSSLVYYSTVNYMMRRILTAAILIARKCERYGFTDQVFESKLRAYIANNLKIPNAINVDKLTGLIRECLESREKRINATSEKAVKEREENLCFICGGPMDFSTTHELGSATLEHVWPRMMGGSSKPDNLKYSCYKCNQFKANTIDVSDYHYEEICLATDEEDAKEFERDFSRVYKVAAWAKNGYECQMCKRPASRVGRLELLRRNTSDSWHFLNMEAYCVAHTLMVNKRRRKQSMI
jgi:5-methylcytosine-specific restriction endonuclease McrA